MARQYSNRASVTQYDFSADGGAAYVANVSQHISSMIVYVSLTYALAYFPSYLNHVTASHHMATYAFTQIES